MEKKQKRTLNAQVWVLITAMLFFGCQNISFSGKGNDVPTAGEITMAVDYGDSFVMNEIIEMFHLEYTKSTITPKYLCEVNLLRQLEMDSFRFVVMNRDFSPDEKLNLEKRDFKIRSAAVGKTSIALIVSKDFKVDSISQAQLKGMLIGGIKNWGFAGIQKELNMVFDQGCGSNYNYFVNHWFENQNPKGNISEKSSPAAVIRFVAENRGALGFVNVNWLSDKTDTASVNFSRLVKVLAIENIEKGGYHLPFQSQISAGQYPFVQTIYMHDLQGYSGLAQGVIAYVASQPGQILMKKSGLIPIHDMGRTIELGN